MNGDKIVHAIAIGTALLGLGYFYRQDTLEEKKRAQQVKFVAPAQKRLKPLVRRELPETEQEQIPGIPPEGMKGLEEF